MARRRTGIGACVAAAAAATALALPGAAQAVDDSPCKKDIAVQWTKERVQLCPLAIPLSNNTFPVYSSPVAKKAGAAVPPATAGTLRGNIRARYFVCDRRYPKAVYYHPSGWWNDWWALTRSDTGKWGWVPEAFFAGGNNGEPDAALKTCPPPTRPPAPPTPPPASPCELSSPQSAFEVRAQFSNARRVATTTFGRSLRVKGRVRAADGSPAPGAQLCVGVQGSNGGPVRVQAMVTADAGGGFAYTLGRGASRRVWFVHRVGGTVAAASVAVRVRAPVRFTASPRSLGNGEKVRFRGRLRGRSRGVVVELQYARGGRWLNFATSRVRRGGRFRFAYRFERTFTPRDYHFRARVPRQRGYPFATGTSRPVTVRVSGG